MIHISAGEDACDIHSRQQVASQRRPAGSELAVARVDGRHRAGPGPSLVLPVCSGNKLEDVEGLPGGRRRATHPALTVPGVARPRKYPRASSQSRWRAGGQEPNRR